MGQLAATQPTSQLDLQEAIRRLNAIQLRPRRLNPEDIVEPTTRPATQPAVQAASGPATQPSAQELAAREIEKALAKPESLPQDPRRLTLLGDALFRGGHVQVACGVYEQAAKLEKDPENRSWLLYQLGNCRRTLQPQVALADYRRLVEEYPNSPWAAVAATQADLLQWKILNQPQAVLAPPQSAKAPDAGPQTPGPDVADRGLNGPKEKAK